MSSSDQNLVNHAKTNSYDKTEHRPGVCPQVRLPVVTMELQNHNAAFCLVVTNDGASAMILS
jgi:hypothetical protein